MSSRGFRLSRLDLERVYDVASEVHANANQAVRCLVSLGLEVWLKLTENQRILVLTATGLRYDNPKILRRPTIQKKIDSIRADEEFNARLGFALPTRIKETIRTQAKRKRTTMSAIAREKLRT